MLKVGDTVKVIDKTSRFLDYIGIVTKDYGNTFWGQFVEVEFPGVELESAVNFFDNEIIKVED